MTTLRTDVWVDHVAALISDRYTVTPLGQTRVRVTRKSDGGFLELFAGTPGLHTVARGWGDGGNGTPSIVAWRVGPVAWGNLYYGGQTVKCWHLLERVTAAGKTTRDEVRAYAELKPLSPWERGRVFECLGDLWFAIREFGIRPAQS